VALDETSSKNAVLEYRIRATYRPVITHGLKGVISVLVYE